MLLDVGRSKLLDCAMSRWRLGVYLHMFLYVCVICLSAYVFLCMSLHMCVCVSACMHVSMGMCIFTCEYVCT